MRARALRQRWPAAPTRSFPAAATGTGLANYTITYDDGSLTVHQATLTITPAAESKTYGSVLGLGVEKPGATTFAVAGLVNGDSVTGATLASAGAAATAAVSGSPYTITASAATGTGLENYTISYGPAALTVSPASVVLSLASDADWLIGGQDLNVVATASTAAPFNADGAITFYDNGTLISTQPLAVAAGEDQAALDAAVLSPGNHLITLAYASSSGNFTFGAASPSLAEIVFPADANLLTVTNTSSDPTAAGSLPWAIAQADASNAASVISFADSSGQVFSTPQTIILEAPLDVTDSNPVQIAGPASGVTLAGDYSQSRFAVLEVAANAGIGMLSVSIGTAGGANGDLAVAGALDVLESVPNLGSSSIVTGGGSVDLGGQTTTADSLTLTDGSLLDGTLSSGWPGQL